MNSSLIHKVRAGALTAIMCATAIAVMSLSDARAAEGRTEIGVLNCTVAGGVGFIFGSSKNLSCVLKRPGRNIGFHGTVEKFGLDIGFTNKSYISWAVLAPTVDAPANLLVGSYGGVSAQATLVVGAGANALIGGSDKSIVLQPLSIQAQSGLNIALGITSLTLRPGK